MSTAIDPVIPRSIMESIKNTFAIQASTPIQLLGVEALDTTSLDGIEVIAVLGIQSKEHYGTLALCFPDQTLIGVLNQMLGESYNEINAENADAAGELMNIIYASARVKINQAGHQFEPAIPAVLRGSDIKVSHGSLNKVTKISCKCEYGTFHFEVSLKSSKA